MAVQGTLMNVIIIGWSVACCMIDRQTAVGEVGEFYTTLYDPNILRLDYDYTYSCGCPPQAQIYTV